MGDLSRHFNKVEFICPCAYPECPKDLPVKGLVDALEKIRKACDLPLSIKSGIRCPRHNADIGGELDSRHLVSCGGDGCDIFCDDSLFRARLLGAALPLVGFIEACPKHVHLDMRGDPRIEPCHLILGEDH